MNNTDNIYIANRLMHHSMSFEDRLITMFIKTAHN